MKKLVYKYKDGMYHYEFGDSIMRTNDLADANDYSMYAYPDQVAPKDGGRLVWAHSAGWTEGVEWTAPNGS